MEVDKTYKKKKKKKKKTEEAEDEYHVRLVLLCASMRVLSQDLFYQMKRSILVASQSHVSFNSLQ